MIKLDDALRDVTLLGLDTSPFIYFIERDPQYVALCRDIFRRITTRAFKGYSSTVTLTEVLVQPLRAGNTALAQRYRRFLLRSRNFSTISFDATIAGLAADLRARYNVRTPDAMQLLPHRHRAHAADQQHGIEQLAPLLPYARCTR